MPHVDMIDIESLTDLLLAPFYRRHQINFVCCESTQYDVEKSYLGYRSNFFLIRYVR